MRTWKLTQGLGLALLLVTLSILPGKQVQAAWSSWDIRPNVSTSVTGGTLTGSIGASYYQPYGTDWRQTAATGAPTSYAIYTYVQGLIRCGSGNPFVETGYEDNTYFNTTYGESDVNVDPMGGCGALRTFRVCGEHKRQQYSYSPTQGGQACNYEIYE